MKCGDCASREFLLVTDELIRDHLVGHAPNNTRDITIGVYPLLHDETCWFVAVDFDKKSWKDDARLDTLFLVMPISWKGTLAQYAGRLHRLHLCKSEVIVYDYVDHLVPTLVRMAERRLRGYRALGYELVDSSSAENRKDP